VRARESMCKDIEQHCRNTGSSPNSILQTKAESRLWEVAAAAAAEVSALVPPREAAAAAAVMMSALVSTRVPPRGAEHCAQGRVCVRGFLWQLHCTRCVRGFLRRCARFAGDIERCGKQCELVGHAH
jgi:hypothetical protein